MANNAGPRRKKIDLFGDLQKAANKGKQSANDWVAAQDPATDVANVAPSGGAAKVVQSRKSSGGSQISSRSQNRTSSQRKSSSGSGRVSGSSSKSSARVSGSSSSSSRSEPEEDSSFESETLWEQDAPFTTLTKSFRNRAQEKIQREQKERESETREKAREERVRSLNPYTNDNIFQAQQKTAQTALEAMNPYRRSWGEYKGQPRRKDITSEFEVSADEQRAKRLSGEETTQQQYTDWLDFAGRIKDVRNQTDPAAYNALTQNETVQSAQRDMREGTGGIRFYNDMQERISRNPLYNPFVSQFEETKRDITGRETEPKIEEIEYLREPELIEGSRTPEAEGYIKAGRAAPLNLIDRETDPFVIRYNYYNPVETDADDYDPTDNQGTFYESPGADYMTDEEKDTYRYILGRYGGGEASRYLNDLTPYLVTRAQRDMPEIEKWRERAEEHPILTAASEAVLSPAGFGEENYYNISTAISEGIERSDGAVGRIAGQALQGVAQNSMGMLTGMLGTPGRVVSAALGAVDNVERDKYDMTAREVPMTGGAAAKLVVSAALGAAEWTAMSRAASAPIRAISKNMSKNALSSFASNMASSMLSGAAVGAGQQTLNELSDRVFMGDNSMYEQAVKSYMDEGMDEDEARQNAMWDSVNNIASSALIGSVTSGAMALPGSLSQSISYRQRGRDIIANDLTDSVFETADRLSRDSEAYRNARILQDRLSRGGNVTPDELGAQDILNRIQEQSEAIYAAEYQKLTGLDVSEADIDENARYSGGRIEISPDADEAVPELIRHEGAHAAEVTAPDEYAMYTESLRQAQNYADAVDTMRQRLRDAGYEPDDATVESEVAADFARNFVKSTEDIGRLERMAQDNTRLTDRVYNAIKSLETKMHVLKGDVYEDSATGIRVTYDELKTMRERFEDALLTASDRGYADDSAMNAVRRNHDAAKYGVAIDEEVRNFAREAAIDKLPRYAKESVKDYVRQAYDAIKSGDDTAKQQAFRQAAAQLRLQYPRNISMAGDKLETALTDKFTALYEEGQLNNSAKEQRRTRDNDRREYGFAVNKYISDFARNEGVPVDAEQNRENSDTLRAAFRDLESGDEAAAREKLYEVGYYIADNATIENPIFELYGDDPLKWIQAHNIDSDPRGNIGLKEVKNINRKQRKTGVDQFYQEFANLYPGLVPSETEVSNEGDQGDVINNIYLEMRDNARVPAESQRDPETYAKSYADMMIDFYRRNRAAAPDPDPTRRADDLTKYALDLETPMRQEIKGVKEGVVTDTSNLMRRGLDEFLGTMEETMVNFGSKDEALTQSGIMFDAFMANWNSSFNSIMDTYQVPAAKRKEIAQVAVDEMYSVCDAAAADNITGAQDTINAYRTGETKPDGTKVTEAEAAAAEDRLEIAQAQRDGMQGYNLSRMYTNSGMKPFLEGETRAEIERNKKEFYYKGITNKETYERADRYVGAEGEKAVIDELWKKNAWTADDVAQALSVMGRLNAQKNYELEADVYIMASQKLTQAGQTVQAIKMISKLSPEGRFISAMKEADANVLRQIRERSDAEELEARYKKAQETDRRRRSEGESDYSKELTAIERGRKRLRDTEAGVTRARDAEAEAARRIEKTDERLRAKREERGSLEARISETTRRIEQTEAEIAETERMLEQSRARAAESKTRRRELSSEAAALRRERDSYERGAIRAEKRAEELRGEIPVLREERDITGDLWLDAQAERERLQNEASAIRRERDSYERGAIAAEKRAEELRRSLPELTEERDITREIYEETTAEREKLQRRLSELRNERRTLRDGIDRAVRRSAELEPQIRELANMRVHLEEQYTRHHDEFMRLRDERTRIRREVLGLRNAIARDTRAAARSGERMHSAVDAVLDEAGIAHVPEAVRDYIHRSFNWIEQFQTADDFIDQIMQTSKIRKTAQGKNIERALRRAAKRSGGTELLRGAAINQLYALITDYVKSPTISGKLRTWRTVAMLVNGGTIMRNIISNVMFTPVEQFVNNVTVPLDMLLSLATGTRSVAFQNPFSGFGNAADRARLARLESALAVNGLIDDNSEYRQRPSSMRSRPWRFIERLLGYSLSVPDEWQKGLVERQIENSLNRAQRWSRDIRIVNENGLMTSEPRRLRRMLGNITDLTDAEIKRAADIIRRESAADAPDERRPRNVSVDMVMDAVRKVVPDREADIQRWRRTLLTMTPDERGAVMGRQRAFTDEEIADLVRDEIHYRTFQDDSVAARVLQGAKNALNKIGTSEFGAGDFIMPFVQVPGNLFTRALEYSPLGYLKFVYGLGEVAYHTLRGHERFTAEDQRRLLIDLMRPTTSIGMVVMGAALKHIGAIIGTPYDSDDDYDEYRYNQWRRINDYKLNLSAIRRLLKGGDGTPQEGDKLFPISWIQPISSTFTLGAGLYDSDPELADVMGMTDKETQGMKWFEKMLKVPTAYAGAVFQYGKDHIKEVADLSAQYGASQFMDLSGVQGIRDLVNNWKDSEGQVSVMLLSTLGDFATSLAPSVLKNLGYVFDPVSRDSFREESAWDVFKNQVKSALPVPWLRDDVPEKVDVWGNTVNNSLGNAWHDALNRMVSPGVMSLYQQNGVADEVERLSRYSPDVLPPTAFDEDNYATIDDKRINFDLRGKDYEEYSKILGEHMLGWYDGVINSDYWKYLSDGDRVRILEDIVNKGQKAMKVYWVYKKNGYPDSELEQYMEQEMEDTMSEPAMSVKREQARRYLMSDAEPVENIIDVYIQVPISEYPEEVDKAIAKAEKQIKRIRSGDRYELRGNRRVYSRDWTQEEKDEAIAEYEQEIEDIRNGTKKKKVYLEGLWSDLTPEQVDKALWYIDEHIDDIDLPEEAISEIPDMSGWEYEEVSLDQDIDDDIYLPDLLTGEYPRDENYTPPPLPSDTKTASSGSGRSYGGYSGRNYGGRNYGGGWRNYGGGWRNYGGRNYGGRRYYGGGRRYYGGGGYSGGGYSGGGYSGGGGYTNTVEPVTSPSRFDPYIPVMTAMQSYIAKPLSLEDILPRIPSASDYVIDPSRFLPKIYTA